MTTIIRVNRDVIGANAHIQHRENWSPVVSAWVGASRRPLQGYSVHISGPSEVLYDPDHQSVFISTESEVIVSEHPPE